MFSKIHNVVNFFKCLSRISDNLKGHFLLGVMGLSQLILT